MKKGEKEQKLYLTYGRVFLHRIKQEKFPQFEKERKNDMNRDESKNEEKPLNCSQKFTPEERRREGAKHGKTMILKRDMQ